MSAERCSSPFIVLGFCGNGAEHRSTARIKRNNNRKGKSGNGDCFSFLIWFYEYI